MNIEILNDQAARNDRGVLLRSIDRETIRVEYEGRTLDLSVDRAPDSYGFHLPSSPVWSDGGTIPDATMELIMDSVVEIHRHQGDPGRVLDQRSTINGSFRNEGVCAA
ncbi:hypothetical protein OHA21_50655 [Actinoplanes sp. NBC_00393]|uniref:hypothetical protein n=1 Tax=Actinoplanes sp. NBC_00393 TaxID=2975953 RepID=UPI002E248477